MVKLIKFPGLSVITQGKRDMGFASISTVERNAHLLQERAGGRTLKEIQQSEGSRGESLWRKAQTLPSPGER